MMQRILAMCVLAVLLVACGEDIPPIDCEKVGPILSLGLVVDAESCSLANGSIKVSATQGKEPYSFSINGEPSQATGEFQNLAAGIYTVTVEDANGCASSVNNVFVKASDFTFATSVTPDNSCLSGSGEVVVDITDGSPPYTYRLGNGSFTDNNTFSNLSEGNHTITVSDIGGCSITLSVTVPRGFTGTSWLNEIKPIIETSCSKSGCHDGISRPDLRLYEKAKFYAKTIKSKTKDRSMPREGTLSQQEIDKIACWVDDGALEN